MRKAITKKEEKEILELMGFTTEEYVNLRKETKKENRQLHFSFIVGEGPIWTDSTVIVSD